MSKRTTRRRIRSHQPLEAFPSSQQKEIVLVVDTTYFDIFGVMVFRSWTTKQNLLWYFVEEETVIQYLKGIHTLEDRGYVIQAVVCDGKKWLIEALESRYPVQLCQFHAMKTVTRYLTKYPKLEAGKELRAIMLTLPRTDEGSFSCALSDWHEKWKTFLSEKTVDFRTGREVYTHRRIRGAHLFLRRAGRYLFTYQKYSSFDIPNTTNTLDGTFSHLKQKANVHRGVNNLTLRRIIETYLRGKKTDNLSTRNGH